MGTEHKISNLWKPTFAGTRPSIDKRHPLQRGLRIHMLMNEGGGNIVFDRAGHGRDGVFISTPLWEKRGDHQTLYLKGPTDADAMDIMDDPEVTEYSYVIWAEFIDVTGVNILTRTDASGPMSSWASQIAINGSSKATHMNFPGGTGAGATTITTGKIWCIGGGASNALAIHNLFVEGDRDATDQVGVTLWNAGDRYNINSAAGVGGAGELYIHQLRIYERFLEDYEYRQLFEEPGADLNRRVQILSADFPPVITPAALTLTLAIPTPTIALVNNPTVVVSAALALTATVKAPTINVTSVPSAQALTLALPTPTVVTSGSVIVTPSALTMTLTLPTPTILTGMVTVEPAAQALTLTLPTPTVALVNNPTVVVGAALGLTLTLPTPTVSMGTPVTVVIGAPLGLTLAQPTPYVGIDETRVFPDALGLTLTLKEPLAEPMVIFYATALELTLELPTPIAPATIFDSTLPLMTLVAESYGRWNTGEYPDFEAEFPQLTLEASGTTGEVISFNTSLPMLTLEIRAGIRVDISLPVLTLEATGTTTDVGSLDRPLPMFTLDATGTSEGLGTFANTLPMFQLEISMLSGTVGDFASAIPMLTLEAYGVTGGTAGNVATDLPLMTLSASGGSSENGTLSKSLPMLTLEAFLTSYDTRFV